MTPFSGAEVGTSTTASPTTASPTTAPPSDGPITPSPADPSGRPTGPTEALAALLAGNRRFVGGRPQHGHDVSAAAAASGGQLPHAVVLGCIDSRVPLEAIFDQTFGSICVVRSGGHVVDRAVLGSVGFAVDKLNVPLIMVLGHERCGAVASTVESLRAGQRPPGDVGYLVDEIAPAVLAVGLDNPDVAAKAMRVHVARTVRRLRDIPTVSEALAAGRVSAVGAVYDLDTGWVDLLPVIRSTPHA
jgi:carbonic anhydrase